MGLFHLLCCRSKPVSSSAQRTNSDFRDGWVIQGRSSQFQADNFSDLGGMGGDGDGSGASGSYPDGGANDIFQPSPAQSYTSSANNSLAHSSLSMYNSHFNKGGAGTPTQQNRKNSANAGAGVGAGMAMTPISSARNSYTSGSSSTVVMNPIGIEDFSTSPMDPHTLEMYSPTPHGHINMGGAATTTGNEQYMLSMMISPGSSVHSTTMNTPYGNDTGGENAYSRPPPQPRQAVTIEQFEALSTATPPPHNNHEDSNEEQHIRGSLRDSNVFQMDLDH
jgi:hypothetical protein